LRRSKRSKKEVVVTYGEEGDSLLTLNGRDIPFVNSVKYLGVIFHKKITWIHVETVEAKAFSTFIRIYPPFESERLNTDKKYYQDILTD
jgi:hypothetical protein